jgi:hypothetical protein
MPEQPDLPQESPPLSQRELRRILRPHLSIRVWLIVLVLGGFLFWLLSQVSNVSQLWPLLWPDPQTSFQDTTDGSSFVLPFKVTNKSLLFDVENAKILCGVDLFYFMDINGLTGVLRDAQFNSGPISIKRGEPTNYPCSAETFLGLRADNSFIIGFESAQHMTTAPSNFRGPLKVIKMCLWMSGTYDLFGFQIPFKSRMFQYPGVPDAHQWIEGPVSPDLQNESWIPPNTRMGVAWGLRSLVTSDKITYAPGALQCTKM